LPTTLIRVPDGTKEAPYIPIEGTPFGIIVFRQSKKSMEYGTITHLPSGYALLMLYGDCPDLLKRIAKMFWKNLPEESRRVYSIRCKTGLTNNRAIVDRATPKHLIDWLKQCRKKEKCCGIAENQ
jgi:hypothetical protein